MTENRISENPQIGEFKKILLNDALVESAPSVMGISERSLDNIAEGSIFYGTGLTTSREISAGMPFDVLSMVLTAERIRRAMGMKGIYHHIADTHAKSNNLVPGEVIDKKANETRELMLRVSDNLGLENFNVILASDFDTTSEYRDIYNSFSSDKQEYVKREVADIEWYRIVKGVRIKMGWIIQSAETDLGFDERIFDREYADKIGDNLSFVYLKAGRTFDKQRPKASPYIQVEGESRLLLKPDEDVRSKMAEATALTRDKSLGGARGYLGDILRSYEKLFGPLEQFPFEDKLQLIIERVTK